MADPYFRLRIGGDLFATNQWSIGINFTSGTGGAGGGAGGDQNKLDTWRDGIAQLQAGKIVPGNLLSLLSSSGRITFIRTSLVGAAGKETAVSILEMGTPVPGTSQAEKTANDALCFSLRTGQPGASNRGRVYWPALHASTGSVGNLDRTALPLFAADMATFLEEAGGAGADILAPQVFASVVSTRQGTAKRITSVAVGNRLDSQRRRTKGEQEIYGVAAVSQ